MKRIKAVLFGCLLCSAVIVFPALWGLSCEKVNILSCLACHDSSFSRGSIHYMHMRFSCEICHYGEDLDLGYVGATACIACHPLDGPSKCALIFFHEDLAACDSGSTCCVSCHLECNGDTTSTTLPSTTTTAAVLTTTSTSTAPSPDCVIEAIYGVFSEEIQLLRYVRDEILSKTPEGKKVIEYYYLWSPAVVKLMEEDEDFKEKVEALADCILGLSGFQVE